jgi:hypothetical protein
MTQDPLSSSILDALTLLTEAPGVDEGLLAALSARLSLAEAAADTEIHQLAVEGLRETLDDAASQSDPANRDGLLDMLKVSLEAYTVQLAMERGGPDA